MVYKSSQRTTDLPTSTPLVNGNRSNQSKNGLSTATPNSPFKNVIEQNIVLRLNPIYNFDNYVVGTSNKLARTAGLSTANDPGKTIFNPLFLYG